MDTAVHRQVASKIIHIEAHRPTGDSASERPIKEIITAPEIHARSAKYRSILLCLVNVVFLQ